MNGVNGERRCNYHHASSCVLPQIYHLFKIRSSDCEKKSVFCLKKKNICVWIWKLNLENAYNLILSCAHSIVDIYTFLKNTGSDDPKYKSTHQPTPYNQPPSTHAGSEPLSWVCTSTVPGRNRIITRQIFVPVSLCVCVFLAYKYTIRQQ